MNELTKISTYEELRNELNTELRSTAMSVCRIGYLLKLARDTEILKETSYAGYLDFASAEFGLDKSQVSRFIKINDRFSIGGNSEALLPEYAEYGSSKLSIMLTLPDEINEELTPDMSKADIQTVKEEYDEEQKVTPLEHATEDASEVPDDFVAAIVKQLNDEHQEPAELMKEALGIASRMNLPEDWTFENDAKENYMPDGDKTYIINVPGQGRFMVKCTEEQLTITSMSDGTKTPLSWEEFAAATAADVAKREFAKPDEPEEKPVEKKPKKVEKSKKTEEQKYNEKQAKIDRETKKKLEEKEDEAIMNAPLPSEQLLNGDTYEVKTAPSYFEAAMASKKLFELRKNDRNYQVGRKLLQKEFKDNEYTGRKILQEITYLLEDYTGLEDGYCILGVKNIGVIIPKGTESEEGASETD